MPEALLSRTDLRELGWPRRAVDGIFRELDVVVVPGFSRPSCGQLTISRWWSARRTGTIVSGLECLPEAEVIPFKQPPAIAPLVRGGLLHWQWARRSSRLDSPAASAFAVNAAC